MAYTTQRIVRFDEVDYARVVYFPRLLSYCHHAWEDFFHHASMSFVEMLERRKVGLPIVHTHADFRAPLRMGDTCIIHVEVAKMGRRSVTSRYRLLRGGDNALCAEAEIVHACIDMESFQPRDIPDEVRAVLAPLLAAT